MDKTYYCRCGRAYASGVIVGFNEVCDGCTDFLHACVNCRQFNVPNRNCTDPAAESVRTPEGRNHCTYFIPFDAPPGPAENTDRAAAAREKLKKLFG